MRRPGPVAGRLDGGGIADMAMLARRAAPQYGISPDCRLQLYPLTENWTFRLEPPSGDPLVLRMYRPGGRSAVEIQSELAWMSAIRADGEQSLVPSVIPTLDGCQLLEIVRDPPLERCFCVAFSCVSGGEPADDELAPWFPRLGALTARLHRQARAWTPPAWFKRPRWDVSTTLGERAHWGPWHASVADPDERRQLQRLADVVTARLERFGTGPERFGLVHADLRLANLLVDGERVTVIDFDDCGFSWYLYDLACALTFNEGRADVEDLIARWVRGYREVEPLSREDETEIWTFLMLRRLMLNAYIGLRPDTELAAELHETGFSAATCAIAEPYLRRFG
jgi:Ser/Thr protein kinase RdoA (MazF antagonist)